MGGEGDGAAERDDVADGDVGGEVVERGAGRRGEVKEPGKGGDRPDGGEQAGAWRVARAEYWNQCQGRDEDDHHASDKRGLCRRGEREAEGLELVAGAEEETGKRSGSKLLTGHRTEFSAIHDREHKRRERHAQEIEQQRGRRGECGFDEDEGAAPDEDDEEEE